MKNVHKEIPILLVYLGAKSGQHAYKTVYKQDNILFTLSQEVEDKTYEPLEYDISNEINTIADNIAGNMTLQ